MTQWVAVLRTGALLGLGWVIAATLAWERFGVLWAALLLVVWVALLIRFHKAMEALARAVASRKGAAPEG
jgi:hypothetical protein